MDLHVIKLGIRPFKARVYCEKLSKFGFFGAKNEVHLNREKLHLPVTVQQEDYIQF